MHRNKRANKQVCNYSSLISNMYCILQNYTLKYDLLRHLEGIAFFSTYDIFI
jgi:hypothetical protein